MTRMALQSAIARSGAMDSQHLTIARMLAASDVPGDGVLLVHSAFKSLARDGYRMRSVLDALADHMNAGTLLMPTMSWRFVNRERPVFNELETPSNTGALTEMFRTSLATARSLHPTHSVAGMGHNVDELLGHHHHCLTPCGAESPFGKLAEADGWVMMLGVGMDCCTMVHHVEEEVAPDIYCRPVAENESYSCVSRGGQTVTVDLRRHKFLPRDYWQFQDVLAIRNQLRIFRCDNSIALVFRARDICRAVQDTLEHRPDAVIARPGQRYRLM